LSLLDSETDSDDCSAAWSGAVWSPDWTLSVSPAAAFADGAAFCTFVLCGNWPTGLDPLLASAAPASATQAATTSNTVIARRDFIDSPPFERTIHGGP